MDTETIEIKGSDIQGFIFDKLGPACQGEKLSHAVMGMLTYIVLLMKPDIEVGDLQDAVMGTSEHITATMAGLEARIKNGGAE